MRVGETGGRRERADAWRGRKQGGGRCCVEIKNLEPLPRPFPCLWCAAPLTLRSSRAQEVLDEQDHIQTKLRLVLDTPESSTLLHRRLALLKEYPSTPFFAAPIADLSSWTWLLALSQVSQPFPKELHLLSLNQQLGTNATILRLQHVFDASESSVDVPVDIASLFPALHVGSIQETSLSANQPIGGLHRRVWRTAGDAASGPASAPTRAEPPAPQAGSVVLSPRHLRTFLFSGSAGESRSDVDASGRDVV